MTLVGPAAPAGAFLQRRQCNQRLGRGCPIQERIKPPGLNARGTPPFRTRADTSDRPKTRWVSALPDRGNPNSLVTSRHLETKLLI